MSIFISLWLYYYCFAAENSLYDWLAFLFHFDYTNTVRNLAVKLHDLALLHFTLITLTSRRYNCAKLRLSGLHFTMIIQTLLLTLHIKSRRPNLHFTMITLTHTAEMFENFCAHPNLHFTMITLTRSRGFPDNEPWVFTFHYDNTNSIRASYPMPLYL